MKNFDEMTDESYDLEREVGDNARIYLNEDELNELLSDDVDLWDDSDDDEECHTCGNREKNEYGACEYGCDDDDADLM